jgi:mannosyltransferase OCH1-like enzyme
MTIPKIIHQTWKNKNIPSYWKKYHESWKKNFPEKEYKHILWTDADNEKFIKENYNWFYNTFIGYPKGIQRADAIRYFILYHYGGIYADLDCEVRENFYEDLDMDNINVAGNPYGGNCGMNNLMASNKNNEKWKKVFTELENRKNNLSTLNSTGPKVLGSLNQDNIKILDYKYYNPLKKSSFIKHNINKLFFDVSEEKTKTWDIAKVVHHGSESWAYSEVTCFIKHYSLIIIPIIVLLCLLIYYRSNIKERIQRNNIF